MLIQKTSILERKKLRYVFLEQLYWKKFDNRTNDSMHGTKEEIYIYPDSEIQKALTYLNDKKWIEVQELEPTKDFPDELSISITASGIDIIEEQLLNN